MVHIYPVTANLAAYVADNTKQITRATRKAEVEQAVKELAHKTSKNSDLNLKTIPTVVKPTSLSLHFLTAGQHQNPQATLEEALDAYEANRDSSEN